MKLTSGRKLYVNNEIVGIDPYGEVYGGYDNSGVYLYYDESCNEDCPIPAADRIELAQIMIARWQSYLTKALSE